MIYKAAGASPSTSSDAPTRAPTSLPSRCPFYSPPPPSPPIGSLRDTSAFFPPILPDTSSPGRVTLDLRVHVGAAHDRARLRGGFGGFPGRGGIGTLWKLALASLANLAIGQPSSRCARALAQNATASARKTPGTKFRSSGAYLSDTLSQSVFSLFLSSRSDLRIIKPCTSQRGKAHKSPTGIDVNEMRPFYR